MAYTSSQAVGGLGAADADGAGDGAIDGDGTGAGDALGGPTEADGVRGLALGGDEQAQTNSDAHTTRASSFIGSQ
jgi:hypothetical protein